MAPTRFRGWITTGLCVTICLWLPGQSIAAPTAADRPSLQPSTGGDSDARIDYPPAHYPLLRMSNGEMHVIHSLLKISHAFAFGDYMWNATGVAPGRVWIRIDLNRQVLSVFRGGDEIGTTLVIYGANNKPTPVGMHHILQKSRYYYSRTYNAPMPYALRLTADGVALHASDVRRRFATHGCIGLPTEFARLLYDAASQGDEVEILPAKA